MPAEPNKPSLIDRLLDRRDAVRRRVLRHRGAIAAVVAAVTVYLVVHAVTAPPPPTEAVWVASRDLASGTTVAAADLVRRDYAAGTKPERVITDPDQIAGKTLAVPVGAGMPIRRDAVLGAHWLRGYPGMSAMPVRITDPAVAPLLTVGDRVDLVATDPAQPDSSRTVARDALVLALPSSRADATTSLTGRLVLVGVPAQSVGALAAASVRNFLTVVWTDSDRG
jgi:Flp pilus assembly protein CpaB